MCAITESMTPDDAVVIRGFKPRRDPGDVHEGDFGIKSHPIRPIIAGANYGTDAFETIGGAAISKNIIAVGAAGASHAATSRYDPGALKSPSFTSTPTVYDPLHVVASYSNKGPSIDGRLKPDLIAPGSAIFSVENQDGIPSGAVKGLDGTSMATPVLAGSLALMQQMLLEGRINTGHPEEFNKIPDNQLTGTLLKALALNAGQHMDYVQNEAPIENPVPMRIQQREDMQPLTQDGNEYDYLDLGDSHQITFPDVGTSAYFYFQASELELTPGSYSTADPKIRQMGLFTFFPCQGHLTISIGHVVDGAIAPLASEEFVFEEEAADERTTLFWQAAVDEVIFVKITAMEFAGDGEPCTAESPLVFSPQEFTHGTLEESQHYADVPCKDNVGSYSQHSVANRNWFMNYWRVFRCPPVAECVADKSIVQGVHYYHPGSSMCRAAIHNNSFNMTVSGIPEVDNRRQFFLTSLSGYPASPNSMKGSTRNGVESRDQPNARGQTFLVPAIAGEVHTVSRGRQQKLMNLRSIPHGPNGISGFGLFQLSSILPLSEYSVEPHSARSRGIKTVERQLAIFSSGQPWNLITHQKAQSYCFMISPFQLRNNYMYSYFDQDQKAYVDSDTWNSGPDNVRVTLAWYDPPNIPTVGTDRHLVNNLNLHVFTPDGSEYRGNARADSRNTNERVELLPGTFKPGMYCAVVHGANVPALPHGQVYSLVGNGRGLERCGTNPFPWHQHNSEPKHREALSGEWVVEGKGTCTDSQSDDVFKSALNGFSKSLTIRQGGNCFTMFPTITKPAPTPTPTPTPEHSILSPGDSLAASWTAAPAVEFRGMRLSGYEHEAQMHWDKDDAAGFAQHDSNNKWALSGHVISNHTISGFYFEQTGETSAENVTFDVSGTHKGDSMDITVSSASQTCRYTYTRKTLLSEVQYSHLDVDTDPHPHTTSAAHMASLAFVALAFIVSLLF
jgi:hypothetical protein